MNGPDLAIGTASAGSAVAAIGTTLLLAWASFAILRSQRSLTWRGHGWAWVVIAGALAMGHWPLQRWLGSPVSCPIVATALYLLSVIGMAPDDTVLAGVATAGSRWFRRALTAAVGGSMTGMAIWAISM